MATPAKQSLDSLISSTPDVCGGSPVIAGTRVRVADIVRYSRLHEDPPRILKALPHITTRQLEAAMAYYRAHRREIEAEIKEDETAAPT